MLALIFRRKKSFDPAKRLMVRPKPTSGLTCTGFYFLVAVRSPCLLPVCTHQQNSICRVIHFSLTNPSWPVVDYSPQEETCSPEEIEDTSICPSYLRPEALDCKNISLAAMTPVAISSEHRNSADESRVIVSDSILLGSPEYTTSRDRMVLAGVSDEDLYGCQIVSKTDIYEMVRDQVRAVLSTTIQQPSPMHTVHR